MSFKPRYPDRVSVVALLVLLTSCTITPTASGGYQLSTQSLASVMQASDNALVSKSTTPSQTMSFSGPMDGGPGTVSITPEAGHQYLISLSVMSNAGDGQVSGTAIRSGNTFSITRGYAGPSPTDEQPCAINLSLTGEALSVNEINCSAFHGMSVDFSGTLQRK